VDWILSDMDFVSLSPVSISNKGLPCMRSWQWESTAKCLSQGMECKRVLEGCSVRGRPVAAWGSYNGFGEGARDHELSR